jgi:hypothetical protein
MQFGVMVPFRYEIKSEFTAKLTHYGGKSVWMRGDWSSRSLVLRFFVRFKAQVSICHGAFPIVKLVVGRVLGRRCVWVAVLMSLL